VAGNGLDASSYRGPCAGGSLLDCGLAPSSAIYYQEVPSPTQSPGYEYLDYWFFYRYNDGPTFDGNPIDKHQADWEGVTVGIASKEASTFDWAAFAEHKHVYKYLRQNLWCDGGGPGSCGTDANKIGQRIQVFVTNGGHASYPEPCHAIVVLGFNV